ncbi:MAG: DUF6879 family protein [Pseudonocardia sp.]
MNVAELGAHIRQHFTQRAFRLETLQQYEVASDGSDFARYLAGEAVPTQARKQPWLDRLRAERDRGLRRSRVRLVTHPITDYTRYECEWGYAPNVDAGEDVRILDLAEAHLDAGDLDRLLATGDFWLLDDVEVVVMHYDGSGQFVAAERASDASYFRVVAGLAWARSESFTQWWCRHVEYHRDRWVA